MKVMNRNDRLDKELHTREHFKYANKKYLSQMSKHPVLVMPSQNVQNLDMIPRVNIIEDL